MKLFLLTPLLIAALTSQDTVVNQNISDLVVLKFRWSKIRPFDPVSPLPSVTEESRMPNAATDPHLSRAISRSGPRRDDPERIARSSNIQNRNAELSAVEQNAAAGRTRRPSDIYIYRIQVRNSGQKPIKNFIWEYKSHSSGESPARQFFCPVKLRPGETRSLSVQTPFAPSRIVTASKSTETSHQLQEVTFNHIEYSDGFTWQRTYWDPTILSYTARVRGSGGRCIAL